MMPWQDWVIGLPLTLFLSATPPVHGHHGCGGVRGPWDFGKREVARLRRGCAQPSSPLLPCVANLLTQPMLRFTVEPQEAR
jgi:hypothetical protein